MAKVSLKLFELYTLETELNGIVNQETGNVVSPGLLNEKIKLSIKHRLNNLLKEINEEKQEVEKVRSSFIEKHGEVSESGEVSINPFINVETNDKGEIVSSEVNPKFVEFRQEFNSYLQEEREFQFGSFTQKDLDSIEAFGNYPTFFKLVEAKG